MKGLAKGDRIFVGACDDKELYLLGALKVSHLGIERSGPYRGKAVAAGKTLAGPFTMLPLGGLKWRLRFENTNSPRLSAAKSLLWQVKSRRRLTKDSAEILLSALTQQQSSHPPITFEVSVYKKAHAFNIPKGVCNELGIGPGDSVHLVIRRPSGTKLFSGRKRLKSGPEIYGRDIKSALRPGSKILVEASEPILREGEAEAESFGAQERAAGFQSNPEIRGVVEKYAMAKAEESLRRRGFTDFTDTSKRKCYDYTCGRGGILYYVEVKGTQGSGESVILTKNEVKHWKENRLCARI